MVRSSLTKPYFGGKRKNKSNAQRAEATGRGPVDMTAVVGAKDRATNKVNARVIKDTDKNTLQDFVAKNAEPDAVVYNDDAAAYEGIPNPHESVKHSVSEYVDGMAHTNGIESFWSMLKRAHKGTFHKISPKHLQRYVSEFAGKHNVRDSGTLAPNARYRRPSHRAQPSLPRPDRQQRAFECEPVVTVPTRRNSARTSVSGVAPTKSTFGSSFGMYFMLQPSIQPWSCRPCCDYSPSKVVAGCRYGRCRPLTGAGCGQRPSPGTGSESRSRHTRLPVRRRGGGGASGSSEAC